MNEQKINDDLLRPLRRTSVWFFLMVAFLGTIILAIVIGAVLLLRALVGGDRVAILKS